MIPQCRMRFGSVSVRLKSRVCTSFNAAPQRSRGTSSSLWIQSVGAFQVEDFAQAPPSGSCRQPSHSVRAAAGYGSTSGGNDEFPFARIAWRKLVVKQPERRATSSPVRGSRPETAS